MTTQQAKKKAESSFSREPSVWVVVGAAVVLLLMIGFMAHHAFAPPPSNYAQGLGLDKHPFPSWVNTDAENCKGDMSKLSPAEKQKLGALYPNTAGIVMKAAYAVQQQ